MVKREKTMEWWEYDALKSKAPYDWEPASRGDRPWDQLDFHLDLGCGRVPKARMGIDLRPSQGATDLVIDLETLDVPAPQRIARPVGTDHALIERTRDQFHKHMGPGSLPFPEASIKSIVTHHAFEHIGPGFERLMNECYRVLMWDGVMRIIVPLFPSYTAVSEYDHKRYFMEGTLMGFCQEPGDGPSIYDAFSERYNSCCFRMVDEDMTEPTDPEKQWTKDDARETRVTLWKHRPGTPGDYQPMPGDFDRVVSP